MLVLVFVDNIFSFNDMYVPIFVAKIQIPPHNIK